VKFAKLLSSNFSPDVRSVKGCGPYVCTKIEEALKDLDRGIGVRSQQLLYQQQSLPSQQQQSQPQIQQPGDSVMVTKLPESVNQWLDGLNLGG